LVFGNHPATYTTYTKPTPTRRSAYSTDFQQLDTYNTIAPKLTANMDQSSLRKLPLEVRSMVYEEFFEGDFFNTSLVPLHICREIKEEAYDTLRRMYKKIIIESRNKSWKAWAALDPAECQALVQRVNTIPPQLVSNKLVIRIQHECSLIRDVSKIGFTSITGAEFATRTRQLIAAVHPCGVELSVNITFHAMSNHVGTNSYHDARQIGHFIACPRDSPMGSQAGEKMLVKVSLLDKTRAQKVVDEAFAEKRRLFEAHRTHKYCTVRARGIDKALESLTVAHGRMNEMVALL
jgi:hypothetical protein